MCEVVHECYKHYEACARAESAPSGPPSPSPTPPVPPPQPSGLVRAVRGGDGGGDGGGPPLPPDVVYRRARYVNFSAMAGRKHKGHVWPYSHTQWNRMQHFFARTRVPDNIDDALTPHVSVLETYVAYVIMNDMHRFQSDLPGSRGEWFSTHLEAFSHGLQSFDEIACCDEILTPRGQSPQMERWQMTMGLPPSPRLRLKLLLPNWKKVRQTMFELSLRVPGVTGNEAPNAEMWRRIEFGIPSSQNLPGGTLPEIALVWSPLPRVRDKATLPNWYHQTLATRGFRRFIQQFPQIHTRVRETTLLQFLQTHGIASPIQLSRAIQACTLQLARTTRFAAHARHAHARRQHASLVTEIGSRPLCVACGQAGTLSKAGNWLRMACTHMDVFDLTDTYDKLAKSITEQHRLLEILKQLR